MRVTDVERLLESVGMSAEAAPERVVGGHSGTDLWRVELADGPHLLRAYEDEWGRLASREAAIHAYLAEGHVPVAEVVAQGAGNGYTFLLLRWLEGMGLDQALAMGGSRARDYGELFGLLQANLHHIHAPDYLADALRWPHPDAHPQRLIDAINQLPQIRDRLLHLDFMPANVIVQDGRIQGLIDWPNARSGDPRFDIARTYLTIRLMPGLNDQQKAFFRPFFRPFLSSWRSAYRKANPAADSTNMSYFLAWAGYGMLHDLGEKTTEHAPAEVIQEFGRSFGVLRRYVERWMAAAGLELEND